MKTYLDVYIDIFILENIVMNYLILWVSAKFLKKSSNNAKLLAGACIGAIYAVIMIFVPGLKVYYSAGAKVLLSALIVAVSFTPEKWKDFLKCIVVFYIISFTFAGAIFAGTFFGSSSGLLKNGVVFLFKGDWLLIFYGTIVVLIIINIFWTIFQSKVFGERLCIPVRITFDQKAVEIRALVDTGNYLKEPITNVPVIVVEFGVIKEILPVEIRNYFENSKGEDLVLVTNVLAKSNWASRFRLIPFSSLGKENGMLIGFKADLVEITNNEETKIVDNVIIGIYTRTLSKNSSYNAILSPEIMS